MNDMRGPSAAARELGATTPTHAVDPVALAQLWADQFQHLTTLAVAGAGGLLVVVQAGLATPGRDWWIAVASFVLAAALGLLGQTSVVDDAGSGRLPGRKPRVLRAGALALIGMGGGAAIALFT